VKGLTSQLRAYRQRQRRVNERVLEEARGLSIEQRLADLDTLTRGCVTWPDASEDEEALARVRERWIRLKTSTIARG
jgi:hypothetical protein